MSKFTNFEGDNLDNYLGHEMIEIKDNYVKSKINVKDYHKQPMGLVHGGLYSTLAESICSYGANFLGKGTFVGVNNNTDFLSICLLYTSPSPRDRQKSRMPSSA